MAITPTKTDARKLREILDPDWQSLSEEALAVLDDVAMRCIEKSFEIYESKAKYVVVGQLYWTEQDGSLKSHDPAAEKLALGPFATPATARTASDLLHGTVNSKEVFRTWTLEICKKSPFQWRKARKEALEAAALEAKQNKGSSPGVLEQARWDARELCQGQALDSEGDLVPCVRQADHPGGCIDKIPNMGE